MSTVERTTAEPTLRIGAVAYLNTEPLIWGLAQRLPGMQLSLEVPSKLARQLAQRQLDVGLIPVVSYFQGTGDVIVSDACIGCRGPVGSVKLLSRVPLADIRTLAVDEGSATSVVLAQVLLERQYGLRPELHPFPLGSDVTATGTDAVVTIGDRAMGIAPREFTHGWDLGEVWCETTGLPFVFAVWVAHRDTPRLELLGQRLQQTRDAACLDLKRLATEVAPRRDMSPRACEAYWSDNLHFVLGPREREGLRLFFDESVRLGLVSGQPALTPLQFNTAPHESPSKIGFTSV